MTASPKQEHRALFLAMQADAKSFPGGIRALAELMGLNATSLANALNPDHDSQPPAFGRVLEIIKLTQGRRGVFAIAQLVGQVPMDVAFEHRCRHESIGCSYPSLNPRERRWDRVRMPPRMAISIWTNGAR